MINNLHPDWRALNVIRRAGAGQDDRLLRAVADELAQAGITIAPSTLFVGELLATPGQLSRRSGRHCRLGPGDLVRGPPTPIAW